VLCELCVQTSYFFTGSKGGHYLRKSMVGCKFKQRDRNCIPLDILRPNLRARGLIS